MLVIAIAAAALVVFAIIGILAAIAIPNLLTAMQRSRQKGTMADMRTLATALEAYGTDHEGEEYPPGEYAAALAPHLQPKYLKALPGVDGWEQASILAAAEPRLRDQERRRRQDLRARFTR